MATMGIPPIQVQTDSYVYVFENDEEAGDFRMCAIGTDVAYCELAVISKLPIRPDRDELNVAGLYKRKLAMRAKQCRTMLRDQRGIEVNLGKILFCT